MRVSFGLLGRVDLSDHSYQFGKAISLACLYCAAALNAYDDFRRSELSSNVFVQHSRKFRL